MLYHVIVGIRLAGVTTVAGDFEVFFEGFINSFHVPLFLFLSGYVYQITGKWESKGNRISFLLHKALNLGLPYVVFSCLYIFLNSFTTGTNHSNRITDIFNIFVNPVAQYWFLYSLFLLFLLWTLLSYFWNEKIILIVLIVVNMVIMKYSINLFDWWLVSAYIIVFGLGVIIPNMIFDKCGTGTKLFIMIAHVTFAVIVHSEKLDTIYAVAEVRRVIGIIASICFISLISKNEIVKKYLLIVNNYSFYIYLLHTIFTAAIRMILIKMGIMSFAVHTVVGVAIGLLIPIGIGVLSGKLILVDVFFFPSKNIKRYKRQKEVRV